MWPQKLNSQLQATATARHLQAVKVPASPPIRSRPAFANVFSVSGRADSGEEQLSTGLMYVTSSDLELVHDEWLAGYNQSQRAGMEQLVAVVFPMVDIPAGATVESARCLFVIDEVKPESEKPTTLI
eukprot:4736878-Prymnesium_polylepis.1